MDRGGWRRSTKREQGEITAVSVPQNILESARLVHSWFLKDCAALPDSGDVVDKNAEEAFHALCRVMAFLYTRPKREYRKEPPHCNKYVAEGAAKFNDCCDNGKCRYSSR